MRLHRLCKMIAVIAVAGMTGCLDGSDREPAQVHPLPKGVSIRFESSMSPTLRDLIAKDLEALQTLPIDGAGARYFGAVFGGSSGRSVLRFIDERINAIFPSGASVYERVLADGIPLDLGIPAFEDDSDLVAYNDGVWLWLLNESDPRHMQVGFDGTLLELTTSRVGIITLGPVFTESYPRADRLATLVHEARHSDCTGGVDSSELAQFLETETLSNPACGHLHADCPQGHSYEGIAACDSHAWGAYGTELVFALALASHCDECTEQEKQVALITASDTATRVLVLEDMLSGRLGPPDMSSGGVTGRHP